MFILLSSQKALCLGNKGFSAKKGTQATLRSQGLPVIPLPQGSPRVVIEQNSPCATALPEPHLFLLPAHGATLSPSHGRETLRILLLLHLLPMEEAGERWSQSVSGCPHGKRTRTYFLDLAHSFFQFLTKTGTTCSDMSSLFRDQRSVLSRGWR